MSMPITNTMRASMTFDDGPYTAGVKRVIAATTGMAGKASGEWEKVRQSVSGGIRTFDTLRAAIDPAFAASQKFAQVQREVAAMVELGSVSQRAANVALEQAASRYMGVATSAERAQQAERAAQTATQQAAQNYEALRSALDPLYASSKRYEQAQETLHAAVATGAVSQEQANQVLGMAEARYLGVAPAAKAAGAGQDVATKAANRLFAAVGGGRMALRQTAFQLNQVAQQGAVTGNYMQALSVQSADLLTIFGTWGILAGGVIAVMGPVIASLITGGEKAKKLDDILSDLSTTVGGLKTDFEKAATPLTVLEKQFGTSADTARQLYQALAALKMTEATSALYEATGKIGDKLGGITDQVSLYEKLMLKVPQSVADQNAQLGLAQNIVTVLAEKYGLTLDNAIKVANAQSDLNAAIKANDMRAVATSATDMLAAIKSARNASGQIPPELLEGAKAAGEVAVNALQLAGYTEQAKRLSAGLGINLTDAADAAQKLASAISTANSFSAGLSTQISSLDAEIEALKNKQNGTNAAMVAGLEARAKADRDATVAAGEDVTVADARLAIDLSQIDTIRDLLDRKDKLTAADKAGASATKKAAAEQERLNKQLDKEAKGWREQLDPFVKYTDNMAELDRLSGRLSAGEMAAAQEKLNVELADSLPLVGDLTDALSEGLLSGFKSGMSSVGDLFKKWLAQLIATAAKNKIVLSMGLTTGTATAAAAGMASSGTVGTLNTIGAGLTALKLASSNFATSAWATLSATWSAGLSGLTGTVGSAFSAMTSAASGWAAGTVSTGTALATLGTTLGAVAAPLAAVAAAVSFFSTKTKLLDSGLRMTIEDNDALVETYKKIRKSKFWGLSSSTSTGYSAASSEVSDPITEAISTAQASILSMASTLGVASSAFDDFSYTLKVSTKGLTDDEISEALEDALSDANDAYSLMIDGLDDLIDTGETATEALERLSTALSTVDGAFDTLNYTFQYSGIAGAAAADSLTDLFGSVDDFSSAVSSYWDTFYSDAEQQEILTRQATTALAAYNVQLPVTRDAYRALIDAQDLSTESGRALWAELVSLSDVMDQILPSVSSLTEALSDLVDTTASDLDDSIDALSDLSDALSSAADDWGKVGDSVSDLIADIRGTAGDVTTEAQAYVYNKAQYETALAAAKGGDLTAAQNISTLAKSYLSSSSATAGTASEARLAQAKVLAQLADVGDVADNQEVVLNSLVDLQDQQVTLLKALQSLLESGNIYSSDVVDALTDGTGLTAAQLAEIEANNDLNSAQVAALAGLGTTSTTQLAALQSIGAASSSQLSTMASALGISKNALTAELASNDLSAAQIATLLSSKAIGTSQLSALLSVYGLSSDQLDALGSIDNLSASELEAFRTGFRTLQGQTGTVQGLLSGIGSTADEILTSATGDETVASLLRTSNGELSAISADVSSLLAEMLDQTRASAASDLLSGLATNSSGQTYLTKSDLTQLASIYGVNTSGKSWSQVASAVASASGSDTLTSGSYELDLDGNKQAKKAALESQLVTAEAKLASVVDSIVSFDDATDGDLVNKSNAATSPYVNSNGTVSWSNGVPAWVSGYSSDSLKLWKSTYWANGGLEDQLGTANTAVKKLKTQLAAYASGGSHPGGLRLVGEEGPELEVTGPSRIYSASQTQSMLGGANDALISEVKALRQEVARLRQEQRQLGMNTSENTRSMKNTLREWRTNGAPVTGVNGGPVVTKEKA